MVIREIRSLMLDPPISKTVQRLPQRGNAERPENQPWRKNPVNLNAPACTQSYHPTSAGPCMKFEYGTRSSGPIGRCTTEQRTGRGRRVLQSRAASRSTADQSRSVWSKASHQYGRRSCVGMRDFRGGGRWRRPAPDVRCNCRV
jgi:hypothetical protein